jgi:hypothetical protein
MGSMKTVAEGIPTARSAWECAALKYRHAYYR